jgi:hypothetical protein
MSAVVYSDVVHTADSSAAGWRAAHNRKREERQFGDALRTEDLSVSGRAFPECLPRWA